MDKHEAHEIVLKQVCKEIEEIAEKIQKNQAMTEQEVTCLDKLYHLKKSMLTASAMEEAEEYEGTMGGNSGRRGRSPNTGRYVSREMGASQRMSYADGYSEGYSEAMSQMNGYPPRRW